MNFFVAKLVAKLPPPSIEFVSKYFRSASE